MIPVTDRELLARAQDLASRAERGELTFTHFLTPRERLVLLRQFGKRYPVLVTGGYPQSERQRIYFLPPYLEGLAENDLHEAIDGELAETLCPVRICGSGYRTLSHRDFLGAILHLGIERDRIGDLCASDGREAILFTDALMADFLEQNLTRVANDAVSVTRAELAEDFDGGKQYLSVSDTVASPRADAVVAALANLSRERAQALFRQGAVEIDYEPQEKCDRSIEPGAVIVIHGVGKFTVRDITDKTRKGRFRLLADKHI
jgi:RNA-binding protein YlmH